MKKKFSLNPFLFRTLHKSIFIVLPFLKRYSLFKYALLACNVLQNVLVKTDKVLLAKPIPIVLF